MRGVASAIRDELVLDFWERGVGLDRWQRDDALLEREGFKQRGLGERNLALLAIRNALFDRAWGMRSSCPACATEVEFEVNSRNLARELQHQVKPQSAPVEWAGRPVAARAPTIDDLKAIAEHQEPYAARRALVARCLPADVEIDSADDDALEVLGRQLEGLDPAAVVSFALQCPACAEEWSATLDVAEALWAEVQRGAEKSLLEVDALARAYGWTEDEILRLSPTRRAAYLQLAEAP